jgi:hypothetical protein
VTITRIRDKGIPDIVVNKEYENPLVLTWQERISKGWGINYDGFWKLFFSVPTRADIIVYAAPDKQMRGINLEGFTPIIKIGNTVYKGQPLGKETLSIFQGINIPKGRYNVQAMFTSADGTKEYHVYQIRLIHR